MIQVNNLKKVFEYSDVYTVALGGINMEISDGEFVAIMGPSGCGKTTLLNILGLLDNPTEGSYLLDGVEVAHMKESQRTALRKGKIGFVFQSFNLIDELTVEQNVELPRKYMGIPAAERQAKVVEVLRRVIILADEPTGNLDSKNGKEVMDLLAELNDDGTTIVMVTHSQRDASYAHRIVNMLDGFLVEKTEL